MPFIYWQGVRNRKFRSIDREPMAGGPAAESDKLGMLRILVQYSRRRARDIARFCVARHGATAVEFALIAPIFLGVLIALFQTAVFLFAQVTLQTAAVQAGRYFMTGQAQNGAWTATTIQNKICPQIQALFTCANVIVVAQNYASFAAANTSEPQLYNSGQPVTTFAFDPGTPGEVMVVQLVYKWSVVSGPLGFVLSNLPNNAAEIVGVTAIRVEPY
jgi:Flp pilus assembly protein TadG